MKGIKHLFEPANIGQIEIGNRIVMLAMNVVFATEDGGRTLLS